MSLIDGLFLAFESMASWTFLLAFLLGCLNGIVFGVLPGLSGSVGIALMIPFTYSMGPAESMALFVAALSGQTFAGSVSAILLNTPGTSPNAATTFDGYPLARQGRGGFAIGISATASFLGTLVGVVVLVALFPVMRTVILAFSFPEFAMLGVLGLTAIAVAARGSMLKGLISGLIGLLISFVGFAPIGGDLRYVFDQATLFDGIGIVPVLIGLFAVAEALRLLASNESVAKDVGELRFGRSQVWEGMVYTVKQPWLVLRSSMLGTVVGIVPAVGGTLASFLAYFQAAKTVKDPKFGQGDPRGVLAPEAANDAKDAGAALPTLAFGIPGSADWAIILGAMIIHGITPGPNLIKESPDIVWIAVMVIVAASLVSSLVGVIAAPRLIQITRIRPSLLAPTVVVLAVTGSYALQLRTFDVLVAIGFGLLGYVMRAIGMPTIPLILGLILGPLVERSYIQSLATFGGLSGFVTRPISLGLLLVCVSIIVYEIFAARRARFRDPEALEEGVRSAIRPAAVVTVGSLGAVGVVGVFLAQDFVDVSRTFPVIIGSLLAGLAAVYVVVALVPDLRSRFGGLIADGGGLEQMASSAPQEASSSGAVSAAPGRSGAQGEAAVPGVPIANVETVDKRQDREIFVRLWTSVALLVGLAIGSLLVGMAISAATVLFLFFKVVGRETWLRSTILTTITLTLLYLMFVALLNVPIEGGSLLVF